MGRTVVRRVDQPKSRTARDWLFLVGGAVILTFALLGVITAGAWVGNKVAGGAKTHHHKRSTTTTSAAVADVARAQAQATAIVKAAQDAGQSIVNGDQKKANRQAQHILANARKQSATTIAAGTQPVAGSAGTPTSAPATAGGATTAPGSSGVATAPTTVPSTGAPIAGTSPAAGSVSATTPNLSGLPASWLVVGYGATFGSGPGNAGSISVINRDSKTFSGVARVVYIGPSGVIGSASAPFSNLAPGQSEALPLNGMAYPSGATTYHIEVSEVH
ncbi:MAG: hypothetical protein M3Z66_14930 [Chloroflexota bacterium]|nr:hypothetical protein [Chloroflexota bacterium]